MSTNHDKPKLNDEKVLRQAKKPWKYSCRWKPTSAKEVKNPSI
jgi:hypothetical protein